MNALDKRDIIGVVGAGTMGAGIAQVAAAFGHTVRLYDSNAEAVERGIAGVERGLRGLVARGRKDAGEVDELVARIRPCASLQGLSDCRLVIEAAAEDLAVKQTLLRQLEPLCDAATILATNTSSLSITALGAGLARPQNLAGMHFFNPAPIMKLVEVVSGLATSADTARWLFDAAARWGKMPVHARNSPGFIVNRVARAFYGEPLRLLQEGAADLATLDALFTTAAGLPMGPFELMDVIGNDVNYAVTESVFAAYSQDSRFQPSWLQKERVAGGLLGRKSGRGWYDYRHPEDRPQAAVVSNDFRPRSIRVCGDLGVAHALVSLAEKAGIAVRREHDKGGKDDASGIFIGDTRLALTDGRSATLRSQQDGSADLILFDLMGSYTDHRRIAVAASRSARACALPHALGFFNALGKTVSVLDDPPGLCVMRTVCMLANEGADAVFQGVCEAAAVDRAMRYGMNHPRGPLRWADHIGLATVQTVLRNLQQSYGLERYRCSLLISRCVESGQAFYAHDDERDDEQNDE